MTVRGRLFGSSRFPIRALGGTLSGSRAVRHGSCIVICNLIAAPSVRVPLRRFHGRRTGALCQLACTRRGAKGACCGVLPRLRITRIFAVSGRVRRILYGRFPGVHFCRDGAVVLRHVSVVRSRGKRQLCMRFHRRRVVIFTCGRRQLVCYGAFPLSITRGTICFVLSM